MSESSGFQTDEVSVLPLTDKQIVGLKENLVLAEVVEAHSRELIEELAPQVGHMKALAMVMAFREDCRIFYGFSLDN